MPQANPQMGCKNLSVKNGKINNFKGEKNENNKRIKLGNRQFKKETKPLSKKTQYPSKGLGVETKQSFSKDLESSNSVQFQQRNKKQDVLVYICTSACCFDVVRRVATEFGMVENPDLWHVYWTDTFISVDKFMGMRQSQRINHFPGMVEICRKDFLAKKLVAMSNRFPSDYDFFPKTWCLPNELVQALNYSKMYKSKTYIVKPCFGSKGRGIQVLKNLKLIKNQDRMICQVYISRPFLIDGFKHDFRIYVVLTSIEPLRVYVYNEGIARFATTKYDQPDDQNFSDKFMHLTNYSVNKRNALFNTDENEGSKRKLSTVNNLLKNRGYDTGKIWATVDDSIIKTILMVVPTLKYCYKVCFPKHENNQACFELLGFDFILNSRLKPYLLEVNHSPSLYCHTPVDFEVKEALLKDTFKLLDLNKANTKMRGIRKNGKILETLNKNKIKTLELKLSQDVLNERTDWENTHMGNFRLIYPCKNDDRFKPFSIKKQRISPAAKCKLLNDCICSSFPNNEIRKNPFPFSKGTIENQKENKNNSDVKKILLLNHLLMKNIYNDINNAGKQKLLEEVAMGRDNIWDLENGFSKQYAAEKEKFTKKVSGALKFISEKPELRRSEKELLSSLLLNPPMLAGRETGDRHSHLGPLVYHEEAGNI